MLSGVSPRSYYGSLADNQSIGKRYPLNKVNEKHAEKFYDRYQLQVEKDVFIRGVLAVRSQHDIEFLFKEIARKRVGDATQRHRPIELKIGSHEYTRLESEILYNAWTRGKKATLMNLSRLHRLLIVACIYAAMTQ
jgi:hypothetical protein